MVKRNRSRQWFVINGDTYDRQFISNYLSYLSPCVQSEDEWKSSDEDEGEDLEDSDSDFDDDEDMDYQQL